MTDEAKKIVDALRCNCDEESKCDICEYHTNGGCYGMLLDANAANMIERLFAELEKTKQERDAAVNDISRACRYCKHFKQDVECCDIPGCCNNPDWNIGGINSGWEWRGVCEENSEGNCGQTVSLEGVMDNE